LAGLPAHRHAKRPFGVWLISAFYLFAGTMNLIVLYRVQTRAIPLSAEQLAILEKASLWGLLPLANLAGAVCLFMLKKIAFYIFSIMLIISGINSLVLMFTIDWPGQIISGQGMIRLLIGYGIGIAVCIYTYRLKQNNTLH
jgi:hypothetical protein